MKVDINVMAVAALLSMSGDYLYQTSERPKPYRFVRPQITDGNRVHRNERSPERLSAAEAKRARRAAKALRLVK